MGRPSGSRNPDYDKRRHSLALRVAWALSGGEGRPATLAALARVAGVSVPTLKHYFGDLDGVVEAALDAARVNAAEYLANSRDPQDMDLCSSMTRVGQGLLAAWPEGLGRLFEGALSQGLGHSERGPSVVNHLLEPTIQAIETRLGVHQKRGELRADADLRSASVAFLSPILLGMLHQHELGGVGCRPLDAQAFFDQHLQAWIRGWGASVH